MSNNNERKAFEEYISSLKLTLLHLGKWEDLQYKNPEVMDFWKGWQARAALGQKQEYLTENNFEYAEISAPGIKAILYTDTINDRQVCRDDLWLATTTSLEKLRAAPPSPPPLTDEQIQATFIKWFGETKRSHDIYFSEERIKAYTRAIIAQARGEK